MTTNQQRKDRGEQTFPMEETQTAHLAGVFDSIGGISIKISKNDGYNLGYTYQPILRLGRPKDDGDPLMGKLMQYCEDNHVRYSISEKEKAGNNRHLWTCKRKDAIENFLEPMLPYLVTHYESAVLMLEQVLPRIRDDRHLDKEGFYELVELADKIRENNRKGADPKYTAEYFRDEWSLAQ